MEFSEEIGGGQKEWVGEEVLEEMKDRSERKKGGSK